MKRDRLGGLFSVVACFRSARRLVLAAASLPMRVLAMLMVYLVLAGTLVLSARVSDLHEQRIKLCNLILAQAREDILSGFCLGGATLFGESVSLRGERDLVALAIKVLHGNVAIALSFADNMLQFATVKPKAIDQLVTSSASARLVQNIQQCALAFAVAFGTILVIGTIGCFRSDLEVRQGAFFL